MDAEDEWDYGVIRKSMRVVDDGEIWERVGECGDIWGVERCGWEVEGNIGGVH